MQGNERRRMAYTFRRAARALIATNTTTAFSFMSNGFSYLMPVRAFGWSSFVIIIINYILIVVYYPPFLIVYERYVRGLEKNIVKALLCHSCR
jgi:predicted RND superfamily exporter protein